MFTREGSEFGSRRQRPGPPPSCQSARSRSDYANPLSAASPRDGNATAVFLSPRRRLCCHLSRRDCGVTRTGNAPQNPFRPARGRANGSGGCRIRTVSYAFCWLACAATAFAAIFIRMILSNCAEGFVGSDPLRIPSTFRPICTGVITNPHGNPHHASTRENAESRN